MLLERLTSQAEGGDHKTDRGGSRQEIEMSYPSDAALRMLLARLLVRSTVQVKVSARGTTRMPRYAGGLRADC